MYLPLLSSDFFTHHSGSFTALPLTATFLVFGLDFLTGCALPLFAGFLTCTGFVGFVGFFGFSGRFFIFAIFFEIDSKAAETETLLSFAMFLKMPITYFQ